MSSTLPSAPLQASQAALAAARADLKNSTNSDAPSPTEPSGVEKRGANVEGDDEGQELSIDGPSPDDPARTVFEDPVSFNVKVMMLSGI